MTTKINYLDESWNFAIGCKGCESVTLGRCWAAISHNRRHKAWLNGWKDAPKQYHKPFNEIQIIEERLEQPLHWRDPRRIGVCYQSDLFALPFEIIDKAMAVMALTPQHTYLVLTKRADRMLEYWLSRAAMDDSQRVDRLPQYYHVITDWLDDGEPGYLGKKWEACETAAEHTDFTQPLPNVYNGVSISTQEDLENIKYLLQVPGKRWISIEPLLEGIKIPDKVLFFSSARYPFGAISSATRYPAPEIDYAVIGCEKIGNKPGRFADGFIEAAISLVGQLKAAGVRTFVKQSPINGKVSHDPDQWPEIIRERSLV